MHHNILMQLPAEPQNLVESEQEQTLKTVCVLFCASSLSLRIAVFTSGVIATHQKSHADAHFLHTLNIRGNEL